MSEWISVKDRLPKRGIGRYIVYVENIANYRPIPDNTIVADWYFCDWSFPFSEYNRVTHWMPLPQKPESEDDTDV